MAYVDMVSEKCHVFQTMKTCFLFGHSDASQRIYPSLLESVDRHIERFGVSEFIVGHYGMFDTLATAAVKEAKGRHKNVRLTMLLPYHPGRHDAFVLPEGFDGSVFPFDKPVPPRLAIIKANEAMIDRSDYLICYVAHFGKAQEFLEYAQRRKKNGLIHICNIAII